MTLSFIASLNAEGPGLASRWWGSHRRSGDGGGSFRADLRGSDLESCRGSKAPSLMAPRQWEGTISVSSGTALYMPTAEDAWR